MSADKLHPQVNPGHEIKEISQDFLRPVEVLREALANSYDAGARNVRVVARPQTDQSGRRILTLDIIDDGGGMAKEPLEGFFGLGFSIKNSREDRIAIGYKGHGTKVYYSALDIHVLTKTNTDDPLFASVVGARTKVQHAEVPEPDCWSGDEGLSEALKHGMKLENPRKIRNGRSRTSR